MIFAAGAARRYAGAVYTVHTDSTGFTTLASSVGTIPDTSDASGETYYGVAVGDPMYSPDGSKVLVQVTENHGKIGQNGHVDDSNEKTYVALFSRQGANQTPEKLVEGRPEFWSADGTAVYYSKVRADNTVVDLYRFDLNTKQSTLMPLPWRDASLGKVPGHDAIFMRDPNNTNSIIALNLDGTAASPDATKTAAAIPAKDTEARFLRGIEPAGPNKLLLTYESGFSATPIDQAPPRFHAEIVSIQ